MARVSTSNFMESHLVEQSDVAALATAKMTARRAKANEPIFNLIELRKEKI